MGEPINRRTLLGRSASAVIAASALVPAGAATAAEEKQEVIPSKPQRKFKLGLVTYNLAPDWDLPTIIERCRAAKFAGVEFRTTHKHGVEPSLSKEQRQEVKKRCADGGLEIWGLGSVCEFHSPNPAVVNKYIEECKRFIDLAHDLGAKGVKVRPNGLPKEVDEEKTLEQIGRSLHTCGQAGSDMGIQIWCEVHGGGTSEPTRMRKIMDIADHPNVGVTWNSNGGDVKDGSVKESFELLRRKIYSCHINELTSPYPYRELFGLFNQSGYDRYTLMEHQTIKIENGNDMIRFMRYYRALWDELSRPV